MLEELRLPRASSTYTSQTLPSSSIARNWCVQFLLEKVEVVEKALNYEESQKQSRLKIKRRTLIAVSADLDFRTCASRV